ncbi:MAG: YfhO family protein [Anaerolineae bacterium]|nr:YfhO family protein [Anaerolineae bacterium]MCB9108957.1 YfhO family protein [Anaerolineales bacterium]
MKFWPGTRRLNKKFVTECIAAGALLALAAVGFFWQILLTPNTWMPAGGGDLAPFLYPNYRFAAENLRHGIIPLWNPHLYSGVPFAADIQSGLFYPINIVIFLLVPNLTYEWLEYLAIFHFWLAGMTMYLCLRLMRPEENVEWGMKNEEIVGLSRSIGPVAALAGALAFQFSDLFIVHFGNLNMIAVAAWLPLIFLLFHRSLVQDSLGLAAASGAVLAIATLAGHIQITLFILLTLGLYTLWVVGSGIRNQGLGVREQELGVREQKSAGGNQQAAVRGQQAAASNQPSAVDDQPSAVSNHQSSFIIHHSILRPFLALLLTLAVTIGLSALLLFPAYEMSRYTPRAELPYAEAAQYSLHPAQMIGLLVPNYFGRDPALHWGPWERVETGYIGIMTLLLALVGAFIYRGRIKWFFVGLAVVSLLLAMGGYSVLHGWLYALAPGFNQLRAPARFILLLDFSLAALAAFGLDQLLQPRAENQAATLGTLLKVLTWGLGGLIVVAAPLSYYAMLVTQDRNPAIFNRAIGAASGVATFALFTIAALLVLHLIHRNRLHGFKAGLAVIGVIALDLFTLGYNVDVGHTNPVAGFDHPAAIDFLQADPNLFRLEVTTDVWHAWQPDTALLHSEYDAWGLYNPLTLADTTLYWSGAPPRSTGRYNFLGIKYIIASKAGAPADGSIVSVFEGDPEINIYLNQAALARVLFVGRSVVVPDHDAAWEAVRDEAFDPATTVILEGGQSLDTQPNSTLSIVAYDIHRVVVAVETDQPGYLVLSDAYYPGWRATIGRQPAPLERANYAFRAVYVPAGQYTVEFMFEPLIWRIGLGVSAVTLLALLGWGGLAFYAAIFK